MVQYITFSHIGSCQTASSSSHFSREYQTNGSGLLLTTTTVGYAYGYGSNFKLTAALEQALKTPLIRTQESFSSTSDPFWILCY